VVLVLILSFFPASNGGDNCPRALAGRSLRVSITEIALSKMERNLIERALFPLFGLRQPEKPALSVVSCALPAHGFLTANLNELVHELHSARCEANNLRGHFSRPGAGVSQFCCVENGSNSVPATPEGIMSQRNTFATAGPIIG
jgi:hypothetical protein